MKTQDKNQLSTADLARDVEYKAPPAEEEAINRGDAGHLRTDRAESLWDATVERRAPATTGGTNNAQRVSADAAAAARPREPATQSTDSDIRLFEEEETSQFWSRWSDIQASFVDEPRRAVELADSLVAETMQRLAQVFATARQNIEHQWDRGEDVTTEEFRVTLQRYRSFFDRLLSV
jgi:hypothetical protein